MLSTRPIPITERRVAKAMRQISYDHGCWSWNGRVNMDGYGLQGDLLAHRLVYTALVGPIPDGMQIDHLCRNPRCVNPLHLEVVSLTENSARGIGSAPRVQREKTHCKRGHVYDAANTRRARNTKGRISRWCRACDRERSRV